MGKFRELDPVPIIVATVFISTILAYIFLPYEDLQDTFWIFFGAAYIAGDGVSTGFLSRFDEEEREGTIVRHCCGPHPSLRCSLGIHVLVFAAVFGVYTAILQLLDSGVYPFEDILRDVILLLPFLMGMWAIGATVWNLYGR